MRLRPVMFGVLVGAAAIGYVVWHQYPFFRGLFLDLSPETAATLRPGMTIDEISAIVGGPPGAYALRVDTSYQRPPLPFTCGVDGSPPYPVVWENQFACVVAECGTFDKPSSVASKIRPVHRRPDFNYLYRDITHALTAVVVVLVGWYVAIGPLARRVRSA